MSNSKRIISLTVVCLFALAAGIVNRAATRALSFKQTPQPPPKPQQEREALAKKPAPSGTLEDRLDKDDGYGIVLFYSMGIRGNLEVCGCPIHPLGGVARRTGYIDAFRKRSPDAAILQVDAGYIFSDDMNLEGTDLRADAKLMNDWIVRANEVMGLDVVNLGFRDLLYAASLLKADAKLKPEKSSLISANVKAMNAGDADRARPAPYVIKVVTGKRLPQPVRIAFIGLSDMTPDERKDLEAKSGFVIEDPLAAAKAALAEVRDKADVTVVVGYLSLRTANKLAMQNEDLDLIIAADERGVVFDPKQVKNALVVFAARETKHLGELRFYTDAEGIVERFTARYVELDEIIPDISSGEAFDYALRVGVKPQLAQMLGLPGRENDQRVFDLLRVEDDATLVGRDDQIEVLVLHRQLVGRPQTQIADDDSDVGLVADFRQRGFRRGERIFDHETALRLQVFTLVRRHVAQADEGYADRLRQSLARDDFDDIGRGPRAIRVARIHGLDVSRNKR